MLPINIRHSKLYYPGPFFDGIPLPIATEAVYVDPLPNVSEHLSGPPEYHNVLASLIKMVKIAFKLEKEPLIDWSKGSDERPIAEVTFNWSEMSGRGSNSGIAGF